MKAKEKHINDFGNDPIPGLVLKISLPFMFAQFVNVLYSIVDRIFIGNIQGTGSAALAGAGVCAPIITLLSSFATLIGIGGSVLFSIRLGANDKKHAGTILANSFSMLLLFSAVLTIIFLLVKDLLLLWFGASTSTFPYADTYLTIYTLGTFFALLSMGMNYFITAQGFPMLGMATTLIGAIVNIILDPVFIFLFHMGIAGAALATVIAQLSSCIFVLLTLRSKKMPIPFNLCRPEWHLSLNIIKMGFSPFLILATDSMLIIALNAVLQRYGGPEYGDKLITCATIVQSYMLLITSPMLGLTGGSQPLISYNYGAGKADRIRKTVFCVLLLCLCFTGFMFLLSRTVPVYFVRIFTNDPEYIELSIWGIRAFTLMIIPLSFQYVFVDALTALSLTRLSLFLSLIRKFSFFFATFLFPLLMATRTAFYAEPFADGVAAVCSSIAFYRIYERYLKGEGHLSQMHRPKKHPLA
ncbi:MAG: MATE family efflux transporter [Suilimivivens sp.]